jgi:DNA-binding MarR family transcriptional regulator
MQAAQNEQRPIPWGAVRLIRDWELLVAEDAARCVLSPHEAGHWAYQAARDYAERYDPDHGTGLIPKSAPLVQDIADFWMQEFGLDAQSITAPAKAATADKPASAKAGQGSKGRQKKTQFTHRQGQFLAFIHLYRKLHRQGPAELDMVQYFRVTPPSAHGMVVKLEQLGLVTREPGVARSVRVAIPEEQIPELEDVEGPAW